jgi:uncharacterized protein YndB with AHSA1/START domain
MGEHDSRGESGEAEERLGGERRTTTTERTSDREITVRRTFAARARIVFEAWTRADLFRRWWVPKSFGLTLLSCEMDARVGGKYRLVFRHEGATMDFFGTYLEVVPSARLVWTNEEAPEGQTVTTVTFEEKNGVTTVVLRDLYPTKEALEASGATGALSETFDQLEALLAEASDP